MANVEGQTMSDARAPMPEERRMAAWVGKALLIQGKIISTENLTIDGRVEGTIELVGLRPDRSPEADRRLRDLRRSYEPFVNGLARTLLMPTPPWWHRAPVRDNWQVSPKGIAEAHL